MDKVELTPWVQLRLTATTLRALAHWVNKEGIVPAEFQFNQDQPKEFASTLLYSYRQLLNLADLKEERWQRTENITKQIVKALKETK